MTTTTREPIVCLQRRRRGQSLYPRMPRLWRTQNGQEVFESALWAFLLLTLIHIALFNLLGHGRRDHAVESSYSDTLKGGIDSGGGGSVYLWTKWRRRMQTNNNLTVVEIDEVTNKTIDPSNIPTIFPNSTETGSPTLAPSLSFAPSLSHSPTGAPSIRPTALPTTPSPTTTVSPSAHPTTTFQPSTSPTSSPAPSISSHPSGSPTPAPTGVPSELPTGAPSLAPTISPEPTITAEPTFTQPPTISQAPTGAPSSTPSDMPSLVPTTSPAPSSQPSPTPSAVPTVSTMPSTTPSVSLEPTRTFQPSDTPSVLPTNFPSIAPVIPTPFPTQAPSSTPTVATAPQVIMVLDGLRGAMNLDEQAEWENVTSQHVVNFYETWKEDVIGNRAPLNITSVQTTLSSQVILMDRPGSWEDTVVVELTYAQTIEYGVFDLELQRQLVDDEDDISLLDEYLFLLPFRSDSFSYIAALVPALALDNWLILDSVILGERPVAPTPAPPPPGISRLALRSISASIVLSACVIVAFLYWDRRRKDARYREDDESGDGGTGMGMNDYNTTDFDNAGQPVDWTNPYSDSGIGGVGAATGTVVAVAAGARGNALVGPGSRTGSGDRRTDVSEDGTGTLSEGGRGGMTPSGIYTTTLTGGTTSTVASSAGPTPLYSSRPSRNSGSLPPLPPPTGEHIRTSTGSSNANTLSSNGHQYRSSSSTISRPSPFASQILHGPRQTSIADTELTDLTYSDGGYQLSDRGSDFGMSSALSVIMDDSPNSKYRSSGNGSNGRSRSGSGNIEGGSTPFSPLHIPDDEAIGLAAGLTPPSSPIAPMLGLSSAEDTFDDSQLQMNGFDMQIQELE